MVAILDRYRDIMGRTTLEVRAYRAKPARSAAGRREHSEVVVLDDDGIQHALVQPLAEPIAHEMDGHYASPTLVPSPRSPRS